MRKIENPDTFRANIRNKLNLLINDEKYSKNLEIGIYNYALKEATNLKVVKKWDNPFYIQLYLDRLRSIHTNLQNPAFIQHIQSDDIKPQVVAFMTHQEMNPEKWDTLIKIKMIKDKLKFDTNVEASTDTFKCRKCHGKNCTYYQAQCRSCDEPMTTFVSCIDCGNRWKC